MFHPMIGCAITTRFRFRLSYLTLEKAQTIDERKKSRFEIDWCDRNAIHCITGQFQEKFMAPL